MRILCIEELAHSPLRWYPLVYIADEQRLEPDPEDACVRSQALAFCRSYLARFAIYEIKVR